MCRTSVMCIEIYGFIPHLAVWGMTRVSTSFVLGALPKMLKCRGGGMTTRPYIYIYISPPLFLKALTVGEEDL